MQIVQSFELALSLASTVPAAIQFIQSELPSVEAEVKADYEAIATPCKALIADVEVDIRGGSANVVTQNVEKTVADLGALTTAVTDIIPKLEADAKSEYAKLYPVILPLAGALKITLPAPAATT